MILPEKITHLNGNLFYQLFLSGAKKILDNQGNLNKINVFPVPDADTGTNLSSTLRAVIDNTIPHSSFNTTANAIALAALNGARGNSGVIFAQFLYGLSAESDNTINHSIDSFAESIKRTVSYIYDAIAEPIEGTMLTVIREWAEFIYSQKGKIDDFAKLFHNSHDIAIKSLAATTEKLSALKLANVVDAGAKGFVLFLEGIIEAIIRKNNKEENTFILPEVAEADGHIHAHEQIRFRYCTECIIRGEYIDKKQLKEKIQKFGDSLVIAGSEKLARIHIHTDQPQDLFHELRNYGILSSQKADDMVKQHEVATARKWNIALVTDSACDLPLDIMDHYQVNMVPINLHFGDNQYLDKITIRPDQFFQLIRENKDFPTTSQPNEVSFLNLYTHLADHYDSIIAVHLSGKFSGTLQNSRKAAERISKESGKQISVLDSKNVSGGLGLITLRIAEAISQGMPHNEIVKRSEEWITKCRIMVSVKNLKYMIKGGRVSPMKGFMANLMNVKPIVSVDKTGKSTLFDKAFSQKSNMKKVMKHMGSFLTGPGTWNYIILHAEAENIAAWFAEEMRKLTGKEPVSIVNISPVICLSAGIGTVAIAAMTD